MTDKETKSSDTNTTITFTNNNFSIRCDKCADIHNAQLEGKTSKPCECDCHKNTYHPYVPYCPPDPCCPQQPWVYPPTYVNTDLPPAETTC